MKNRKNETLFLAGLVTVLALCAGWLTWRSTGSIAPLPVTTRFAADSFNTGRHLVEVRAELIMNLLQTIKKDNEDVFDYDDQKDGFTIVCRPNRQVAFDRIFLNDGSLTSYSVIRNNPIRIDEDKGKFHIPVTTAEGQRFVQIPADILQSMLLATEP